MISHIPALCGGYIMPSAFKAFLSGAKSKPSPSRQVRVRGSFFSFFRTFATPTSHLRAGAFSGEHQERTKGMDDEAKR